MQDIKDSIQVIKDINSLVRVIEYYGVNLENNKGLCPFHEEKTPSFHIHEKNRNASFKCFGCGKGGDIINFIKYRENIDSTIDAVKKAYDILDLKLDLKPSKLDRLIDTLETRKKYGITGYKMTNMYFYLNRENEPIKVKIRYKLIENNPNKKSKDFRTFVIDKNEKGNYSTRTKNDTDKNIIYNYPNVIKAIENDKNVYFVEGEKDAENLKKLGLVSTTLISTSENWDDDYTKQLTGAKIIFIGDTGEPGEKFKRKVFENLKDHVKTFRVVDLPGIENLGDNKDVSDWLNIESNTKEDLIDAIKDSHDLLKDPIYKYLDSKIDSQGNIKYTPQKIWENLDCLLKIHNINIKYNELSKSVDINGLNTDIGENAQLYDIHSLCHKNRLKLNINDIQNFVDRIAKKNKYNPVRNYLNNCFENWDKQSRIKDLCDTIKTPDWYSQGHKEIFIIKWLINTVRIPFNTGEYGCEGVLVFQGSQGVGKTRWIKSIIPNYNWVKTGLEIDPSDKDKIKLATKYWVSELGEMDSTLKKDQAKLKAFFTESKDEYRLPYARREESYPRNTSFYATVNDEEFLKDSTGNRRYWVIPVESINVDHDLDLNQIWGEVMHLWKVDQVPFYLTEDDYKILNENNKNFEVKDEVYVKVSESFNWDLEKEYWVEMRATEIADNLGIKNMTSLGNTLKKFGLEKKRSNKGNVYKVPLFNYTADAFIQKSNNVTPIKRSKREKIAD